MLMPVLMFLKSAWFRGPEKGRFGVAEFSTRSADGSSADSSSSAGIRTAAPGLSAGSVGGLRCVAMLLAAWCGCVMPIQAGPTVYGVYGA
jgi:hypothetical protein